ncbi:MAG: hypothetical protein IPP40_07550 [bacterium]|nr:hypothetical protein [bacterium]
MKCILLLLTLPALLLAQQPVVKGERVDDAIIVNTPPKATESQSIMMEVFDEETVTRLEPVFQALEDRYRAMIDELAGQVGLAAPEQQEQIEAQAIALKQQLQAERLQVALQYATEHNNTAAAERVQATIDAMNNPQPAQRVTVNRDPVSGAETNEARSEEAIAVFPIRSGGGGVCRTRGGGVRG